ncbi:MAG TPA: helix-turn-helix transcriptional regulator [Burkholderiales bacterium]|nr:helix-turn-helix transcriptional regulator [Burkholderiales bacterium]
MKTLNSVNPAAKEFGLYVRSRRLALGLSRAELAHRLGLILGSHVSHVERGEARVSPGAMADWARALEVEPRALSKYMEIGEVEALPAYTVERGDPNSPPQLALA